MANTNRSLIRVSATADIIKRELGFQPRYIIVDNMSDVDMYLYDQVFAADPITAGQPPLDVIPKKDFKIIIAPAGVKNYSLAWGAGASANQYVGFVLTDDTDFVRQFHQTNLPNVSVSVSGNVGTTSTDGAHATIGATTDAESAAGNGSVIALLKRLRTLLSGSLATTNAASSQTDGHSATIGATTDAESAVGNGSVVALLKNLRTRIGNLETYLDGVEAKLDTSNTNTNPATAPTLYTVNLALANTEYSQALPANTRRFVVQARTAVDVRLAYTTGLVATPTDPYQTIKSGTVKIVENIKAAPTLYLASGTAGTIVEIEVWA